MSDLENQLIFSNEYSSESTNIDNENEIQNLPIEETTLFKLETDNYTILKPKRIIIKAIIRND